MKPVTVPEGYQQVMPYLIVPHAVQFIEFMQKVFGAREKYKAMRDEKLIMHAEIIIGDSVIMLADSTDTYPSSPAGIFVYVDDCDSVYRRALDAGAVSVTEPADQNYGRSAGVRDKFGNTWWITTAA